MRATEQKIMEPTTFFQKAVGNPGPNSSALDTKPQCKSIKSKKNKHLRCPNPVKGDDGWCAKHKKSQIEWTRVSDSKSPFTKKQKDAAIRLQKWARLRLRIRLQQSLGPATFCLDLAHNDKDIYTYEPSSTIPLTYRFSYSDGQKLVWIFDIRFLLHMLQYGNEFKNPFTQDLMSVQTIERLQTRAATLRKRGQPIVYLESDELTPEQIWNQKVLDVFLKLSALGYSANVLWFESLTAKGHSIFYTRLYNLWNHLLSLTVTDRERIIPGHNSGRNPLFRFFPEDLGSEIHELKWWRKQTLSLMNAFLNRGPDKQTQGCGALYILTALAQTHPRCAESYPWLVT